MATFTHGKEDAKNLKREPCWAQERDDYDAVQVAASRNRAPGPGRARAWLSPAGPGAPEQPKSGPLSQLEGTNRGAGAGCQWPNFGARSGLWPAQDLGPRIASESPRQRSTGDDQRTLTHAHTRARAHTHTHTHTHTHIPGSHRRGRSPPPGPPGIGPGLAQTRRPLIPAAASESRPAAARPAHPPTQTLQGSCRASLFSALPVQLHNVCIIYIQGG